MVFLGSIWSSVLPSRSTFDPTLRFDPFNSRWIFIIEANSQTASSVFLVDLSQRADPAGSWNMYKIVCTAQGRTGAITLRLASVCFRRLHRLVRPCSGGVWQLLAPYPSLAGSTTALRPPSMRTRAFPSIRTPMCSSEFPPFLPHSCQRCLCFPCSPRSGGEPAIPVHLQSR